MFTGIIEATAEVLLHENAKLTIARPATFTDLQLGSSVAISGACLSVVQLTSTEMTFDVTSETYEKTMLQSLKPGNRVNLERALPASGRFEGHMVQGHIEGTAEVLESGEALVIELPKQLLTFVIPKGSLTIDGVSLTVASLQGSRCSIALIPHTLRETTLGSLQKGDHVNIEPDMIGKYLKKFLEERS